MSDFWTKKAKEIDEAVRAVASGASFKVSEGKGFRRGLYEREGRLDYDAYRRVQNEGNQRKLGLTFAKEHVIARICKHARKNIKPVTGILCHGTRNGSELRWFAQHFPSAEVLGTDIADSATQFPNTIQWDFHDLREDWRGKWSIVYTNSWDHAMEPERAFRAWGDSLHPGGILYLEYSSLQGKGGGDRLDLFGADEKTLTEMVTSSTGLQAMRPVGRLFSRRPVLPFRRR